MAWGELIWDVFPEQKRLGGGAANLARHAHRLGARAALVSAVGDDDAGRQALAELARSGVDTALVRTLPGAQTGSVRVELEQGEPRYRLQTEGPRVTLEPSDACSEQLASVDALCFGLFEQRRVSDLDALERLARIASKAMLRLCDLNLRRPLPERAQVERALSLASAVKLNEREAGTLCRLFGCASAVDFLLDRYELELVALTRGARGALLATGGDRIEHPGFPVSSATSSVGAGDAFGAALVIELLATTPLAKIAARANAYAARALETA